MGAATARLFAEAGARVVIVDRNEAMARDQAAAIGRNATEGTAQDALRLSSRIVTGPSFTSETSIMARKTPSATRRPEARAFST